MATSCHWLIAQELKWRTAASAVWTWLLSLAVIAAFLVVWTFSPFKHLYNIYDYVNLMLSFHSWFIALLISCLSTTFIKLHMDNYLVSCHMECTRFGIISHFIEPKNLFYATLHSVLGSLLVGFVARFSENNFSSIFVDCGSVPNTYRCINESCFILLLFGGTLSFFNFMSCEASHAYTLHFPNVQQGRFLSLKCHFVATLSNSAKSCAKFLKYFLVVYYMFGFIPRNLASNLLRHPQCDSHLISVANLLDVIPLAWTLWISGTLLLLLHNLSWHLFNIYNTQVFQFPIDSVFPEDSQKLLTANLDNKQPPLVQHLAFQYLSNISRYSLTKRKQIFMMNYESSGNRLLKWDVIADQSLARIDHLTDKLKDYQHNMSLMGALQMKKGSRSSSKSSSTSSQSSTSINTGGVSTSFLSVSTLRRRPLSDTTHTPNMSYFEVSALDSTNLGVPSQLNASTLLNGSTLAVPTPKLWTRQSRKHASVNASAMRTPLSTDGYNDKDNIGVQYKTFNGQLKSLGNKMKDYTRKIPIISYFVKKMPDRASANLFSDHHVYNWALGSLSHLVSASLTEDECGFVQRRLHDVITSLLELLNVLEKNCKLTVTSSSATAQFLLRQQYSLKAETKSAIYRITNTFSKHVEGIPVNAEHRRKLRSFIEHRE